MKTGDGDMPVATDQKRVLGTPSVTGSSLALLFWWQSLTPTLIPRSWEVQAALSAVCVGIGYGIGTLAGGLVQRLLGRPGRSIGDLIRRRSWIVLVAAWLVAVILGARTWTSWQNEQRTFMGMTSIVRLDGVLMSALSLLAGVLLVLVGRVISKGVAASNRCIQSHPPPVASATALVLLLLVIGFGRGAALRALTAAAHSIYARANEQTTEGIRRPDSSSVSGSRASFVAWDSLGRMGRDFVATATTRQELRTFHGADAKTADPVRVYVGVSSADSIAERAQLAVRELERAGGFERKVLVVWVPTGTGWMVAKAATALEELHRGDTAIVAIQYSFLPSQVSVLLDAGLAKAAGTTLFNAVRARWSELAPDRRPNLVLFGKSLGAAGVEAPFVGFDASSSVADMVARTEGVLVAGAPQSNPILAQLTRERDPRSPVWQPVFDGGRSVRFLNRDPHQSPLDSAWSAPRIAYLQHPGDPVPLWNVEAFWWPPEWMHQPRGFDVPVDLRWFPIVSGLQALADFFDQLGPPPGFGHDYSTDYVRGWACVVPPEGWTDLDTERLERFIDSLPGGDSEP
jgi:uncharacterized membrane protein